MSDEKKGAKKDWDGLFERAEKAGLTVVQMRTRTEKTGWFVFHTGRPALGDPSQILARLNTPREVEIFTSAYTAAKNHLETVAAKLAETADTSE